MVRKLGLVGYLVVGVKAFVAGLIAMVAAYLITIPLTIIGVVSEGGMGALTSSLMIIALPLQIFFVGVACNKLWKWR